LEGFCEDIGPHLLCWTVTKVDFTSIKVMFDEEVFCFDVFSSFGAGDATILFEGESAHIVLIYDIIQNCVTLGFEEMACP
jgi:hypothetical protein